MKTLMAAQGNAPVAVFVMTAADVLAAADKLGVSSPDPAAVLEELQINAGEKPFADQLVDELEQIVLDMAQEREE